MSTLKIKLNKALITHYIDYIENYEKGNKGLWNTPNLYLEKNVYNLNDVYY